MGVHDLWFILSDLCERKPLTYLSGKKIAVDLSGWVVQATSCKGLSTSKNPHLRNLFFRINRLLQYGAYPIFIIEGKPPDVKQAYFKDRFSGYSGISRSNFDRILDQCQELINALGLPCIKSSGEAEAFCAFLCLKKVVEGVITEDNDAFLYGAEVVYRDFSIEPTDSHVNVYCLKSVKNKNKLDRNKLVALALLLGCDYSKGVPGVGKETAVKLLSELSCEDILQRFKDWKILSETELFPGFESGPLKKGSHCAHCKHLGSLSKHKKEGCTSCDTSKSCHLSETSNPCRCSWHVNDELKTKRKIELKIYNTVKGIPDFPNVKVIDEYLNFTDVVPDNETLTWNCPDFESFQEKTLHYLNWTLDSSHKKLLPLITCWQQYKLELGEGDKTNFIYEPLEILKERSIRDISHFEVKWRKIRGSDSNISDDDLVTLEYGDRFSTCYRKLVNDFYHKLEEQKKSKMKAKKFKSSEKGNKKIDEFFVKKRDYKIREELESSKCLEDITEEISS